MSDDTHVQELPEKPLYDITSILTAAVDAFNASRYIRTANNNLELKISLTDLTIPNGNHALNPPGSFYRKMAIFLADHFGNTHENVMSAFGIKDYSEYNGIIKSVNTALKASDYKYHVIKDRIVKAGSIDERLVAFASIKREFEQAKTDATLGTSRTQRQMPASGRQSNTGNTVSNSTKAAFTKSSETKEEPAFAEPSRTKLEHVEGHAIAAFNYFYKMKVSREELNGKLQKGSAQRHARSLISYAVLKCIPKDELSMTQLAQSFGEKTAHTYHADFRDMIRTVKNKDREILAIIGMISATLKLSELQETYLKAGNDMRFENWAQVLKLSQMRNTYTQPKNKPA